MKILAILLKTLAAASATCISLLSLAISEEYPDYYLARIGAALLILSIVIMIAYEALKNPKGGGDDDRPKRKVKRTKKSTKRSRKGSDGSEKTVTKEKTKTIIISTPGNKKKNRPEHLPMTNSVANQENLAETCLMTAGRDGGGRPGMLLARMDRGPGHSSREHFLLSKEAGAAAIVMAVIDQPRGKDIESREIGAEKNCYLFYREIGGRYGRPGQGIFSVIGDDRIEPPQVI